MDNQVFLFNSQYVSDNNTYDTNDPKWIVIHNTDNYSSGADALRHATAQHNGDLKDMSAHWYTDDSGTAYQAAPVYRGCWHVGRNYGSNNMFGTVNNRNSVAIEMCVQDGYDYEKAFQATVKTTRMLMLSLAIPADHVVRHYDVCSKHCPSAIIDHGDWDRFKSLIMGTDVTGTQASDLISTARAAYNGDTAAQNEIIERLGSAAQMAWNTYGFLPSVLVAQCIQESGWLSFADESKTDGQGHTGLTPASNNCLGMNKDLAGWVGDVWGGKYGYYWVPQEHNGVTSYGIETMREYADIEHCLADFAGFRTSQHPCIIGNTDYNSVIDNGLCGGDGGTAYATGSQYGPHLKARIQQYNLTRFDMLGKERKMVSLQIKTCSKGDHDNSVLQLQRHLIGCGYDLGEAGADGDYGDKTAEAVSAYEQYIWDTYGTNIGSTDADGNFCTDGMAGEKVMQSLFGI